MRQLMKRVVVIALAAVMALSFTPMLDGAGSVSFKYFGAETALAAEDGDLTIGETENFSYSEEGFSLEYTFVPEVSGIYDINMSVPDGEYDVEYTLHSDSSSTSSSSNSVYNRVGDEEYFNCLYGQILMAGCEYTLTFEGTPVEGAEGEGWVQIIENSTVQKTDLSLDLPVEMNDNSVYLFTAPEKGYYQISVDSREGSHGDTDWCDLSVYYGKNGETIWREFYAEETFETEQFFLEEGETAIITLYYNGPSDMLSGTLTAIKYSNNIDATELVLDEPVTASSDGESLYYSFTPEEDGEYVLLSSDVTEGDPYVTLYDEDMIYIADDDDGNGNTNFRLEAQLEAGKTYYFEVSNYYSDSFSYNILLKKGAVKYEVTFDLNTSLDQAYYEVWNDDLQDYERSRTETAIFSEEDNEINRWDGQWFEQPGSDLFLGWSTDPEATEAEDSIEVTGSVTVYAVWRHQYTVTFDANGGYFLVDGEEPAESIERTFADGDRMGTINVYHADVFQSFDGWYDQRTGGTRYDADTAITKEITLYAHWNEISPETLEAENISKTAAGTYQTTYRFTPDEDGIYIFNSADMSESYPKVTLYDQDMNELSSNYSQISGGNFLFQYELEAGQTYYFVIRNNKQSTYDYPVKIVKAATATVTFDVNRDDATLDQTTQTAAIGYLMNANGFVPQTPDESVMFAGWSTDKNSGSGGYYFTIAGDTTLYAVWKEKGTVTFHANHENAYYGYWDGGTYQRSDTRSADYIVGTLISQGENIPSWENVDGEIVFAGWSTDQNADKPDAEITASDGLDLYAVWREAGESSDEVLPLQLDQQVSLVSGGTYQWYSFTPEETGMYCIASSGNNGCDPFIELYDAEKHYLDENDDGGSNANFRLVCTLSAGEQYYFKARNYNNASGLDYKILLTKPVMADVTFYANRNDAYFVEWDDDDNEIRSESRTEGYPVGDEIDWDYEPRTENTAILFAGWSVDPNATEADDKIVAASGLKLYAVWKDAVEITYDTNCASLEDAWFYIWDGDDNRIKSATDTVTYTKGSIIYRYNQEIYTANARLSFLGWSENKNATEADNTIKADKSKTLYAVWGENAFITYDANGGYFQNMGTICANKILKGEYFEVERIPLNADPTKVFAGWATAKNASEPDVNYDTVINDDMTLYAVWKDGIKVTIDANGGYFVQNGTRKPSVDVYVLAGSTIRDMGIWAYNDDVLKADYGYRSQTAAGEALDPATVINAPMTLYVKWADLVEVTFDAQNGLINGETSATEYWEKGTERFISSYYQAISNDPAKVFVGWSKKRGDASEIVTSLIPDKSVTLYAIYSDGYRITLESADSRKGEVEVKVNGEWISSEDSDNTFIWPKGLTAENLAYRGYSNDGYLFKGLSTSKDKKDIISDSFIPTKAMTLYGIFVPGYSIIFQAGEGFYNEDINSIFIDVEQGDAIGSVPLPQPPAGKVFAGWMLWDEARNAWVDAPYEVMTHKPDSFEAYRAKYEDASGQINIGSAQISVAETVKYTGKALTPAVTVKYNGKTLTKNTDYTVSYSDNISVGMAAATITGKGNYTGTRSVQFRILFTDVDQTNNFYDAIYWMVDQGYTTGYSDGTYRPWNSVNRAAVVTFLWRMAGEPEPSEIATFKDMPADTPGNQDFRKAISWAAEQGITTGYAGNLFKPWANCNRAAIVTFLWRYQGKPSVSTIATFKDMPADTSGNQDFRKAISWAAANGITSGWSDNTFRPWNDCNRAAMASFLSKMQ